MAIFNSYVSLPEGKCIIHPNTTQLIDADSSWCVVSPFQLFSAAAHKLAEVSRRCTTGGSGGWWSRGKTLLNLQTVHVVKLSQKLSSFASLGGGRYQISLNFESLVYLCCYFLVWNTLQVWHIRCEIFVGQSPSESLSLESLSSPSWHRHGREPGVVPCDGSTSLVAKLVSGLLCGKSYINILYIYIYIVDYVYHIYSIQLTS